MKKYLLTIDLGSTFSKGALFSLDEKGELSFLGREETPTTTEDLTLCFYRVKEALLSRFPEAGGAELFYSSSAKGGLSVVALGVVPELTLQMAKLTAYSAGAKITKVFAYKLKRADLKTIQELKPDIILFSGGTNGGNENVVLHNAQILRELPKGPAIIFAGNDVVSEEVAELLKDHHFALSENILPELEKPNPEPARELIREIFLKQITVSKGIHKIMEKEGKDPYPTPYSVYELMKVIAREDHEERRFQNFALVDMGGATTDFYSYLEDYSPEENVIIRGVPEPEAKRTVEGDLGMRVNALSCLEQGRNYLQSRLSTESMEALEAYVQRVHESPELRPQNAEEVEFDHELARICLYLSMRRHSGTRKGVFTSTGLAYVQQGKDLRTVDTLILTGGWMSRQTTKELFSYRESFFEDLKKEGIISLIPEVSRYLVDKDYILPLLANFHEKYSKETIHFIHRNLKEIA